MEFYVVKDLVQIMDVEELLWAGIREHPPPCLHWKLKFPWGIEPKGESDAENFLAGSMKEMMERNDPRSSARVCMVVTNSEDKDLQECYIEFSSDAFIWFFSGPSKIMFKMTLSLCHLPTEDTPVSPDALFTQTKALKPWKNENCNIFGFRSENRAELEEIQKLWSYETGFVYSKLTIVAAVNKYGAAAVMTDDRRFRQRGDHASNITWKMFDQDTSKDLEIICGNGKMVKAHSAILSASSAVFQAMFEASDMEEAKTGKLEMKDMSEEGVRTFLAWIYSSPEVLSAYEQPGLAVELLIAGDKYKMKELVIDMEKIILFGGGLYEECFTMKSALDLYRWVKVKDGKRRLKEKAVRVLKFIGETYPEEKLVGSEEYQEFIKNETAESAVSTGAPTEERDWFDEWEKDLARCTRGYLSEYVWYQGNQ